MATTYKWINKTSNKLEQAAKVIKIYCVLNNLAPSETGVLICAYIMVYGLNPKVREGILKTGLLGTENSLNTELYSLRRMGLLEGTKSKTRISSKILPPGIQGVTQQTLVLINLDNSNS